MFPNTRLPFGIAGYTSEFFEKVDVTSRTVMEIMTKTTEYLQPNP
ncbi:hypothetical protein scyTo_0023291, partial [Scyliorhinus torazame]|nr:hypothetical protein [Scyliorhinus torazame]